MLNVAKIVKRVQVVHHLVEDWYLVLGYYCMIQVIHAVVHMCHMMLHHAKVCKKIEVETGERLEGGCKEIITTDVITIDALNYFAKVFIANLFIVT